MMAALALLPGIALVAMALAFWAQRRHFAATARRVEGTVVRHDFRVSRRRRGYGGVHHPVVAYEVDGVALELVSGVGQTTPRFRKGAQVGVLFPPGDPKRAVLDATVDLYFYPILFAILGALALLCGLWFIFGPR